MDKPTRQQSLNTQANRTRRKRAIEALVDVMSRTTRPGFYGSCKIELSIGNGTIQNIRRHVDQDERFSDPDKRHFCERQKRATSKLP